MTSRSAHIRVWLALLVALGLPSAASAKAVFVKRPPVVIEKPPPEPEPAPEPEPELDLDERSLHGRLRLSLQHVDRTERRLVAQADGTVPTLKVSESGFFTQLNANLHGVHEATLGDDWMVLVDDKLRADLYDPERVNSERYNFFDNRFRADLGTLLSEATLLDIGAFWDEHKEAFDPVYRTHSAGAEVIVDRELSGYRNLTGSLELRRTSFDGLAIEDNDQVKLTAGFFRYYPETLELDVLPVPSEQPKKRRDSFEYASDLEMGRSRDKMLDLGAGRLAHASREPEPVPIHRQLFRDHVDRREAAFGVDLGYTRRFADAGGAGTFQRGTAHVFGRRAPENDTVYTIEDQLDYTDRDAQDGTRFLFNQFDNRASIERSQVRVDASDLIRGSLESTITADNEAFDTNRLVIDWLSWRHFGRRYEFTSWIRGYKQLNRHPALDFQDREGYKSKNTFTIVFGPESALDLSLLYERMAVQGLQTEFDSTYADRTWELKYRRQIFCKTSAEVGYRDERETHQCFVQNNRDEQTVFLDLVADL